METVGAILRKLREDQGLTIEDIAGRTRIRSEILRGIEEGDYHQISDGPFLRGFVKSYAQALELSEEETERLLDFMQPMRTEVGKQPREESQRVPWTWYGVGALAAVAAIVAVLLVGKKGEDKAPVVTPAPAEAPVSEPVPAPAPPAASEPKPQEPPQVQPSPAVAEPAEETEVGEPVHLKVRARESCWVRISLDGNPSQQTLLAFGETRSWEARTRVRITLGNAGGVALVVNGEEHDNLGAQGEVIKDIVITSEGLKLPVPVEKKE